MSNMSNRLRFLRDRRSRRRRELRRARSRSTQLKSALGNSADWDLSQIPNIGIQRRSIGLRRERARSERGEVLMYLAQASEDVSRGSSRLSGAVSSGSG